MKVSVIGLGKLGLPLAAIYSQAGHEVVGVDVNPGIVQEVNSPENLQVSEPWISEMVVQAVSAGKLRATVNMQDAVPKSDVVVVVIPLILDDSSQPNFSPLDEVTQSIGKLLKRGSLVVYETTLPVGATRNRLTPILEENSGLEAGKDFYVAYSPERVYSGRILKNLKQYPKLVGGINPASAAAAISFYESALEFESRSDLERKNGVWDLGSPEAAELAKLAETTYRDVNIALANQLATYAHQLGVDVYKVIAASNSQPFSHIHQPGVAVGGHCIPVYPELYLSTDPEAKLVSAARKVNLDMPARVVELLRQELGSLASKRVVILGLAYRGGVKEDAYSGAWSLRAELDRLQAEVFVHDPLYSDAELLSRGLRPYHFGEECDGAILQSNHTEYLDLSGAQLPKLQAIVDGRNFLNANSFPNSKVVVLGIG